MSTGKVVLGTLAGLAIGAIAGILFAPEKGSTTRRQIMKKGEESLDEIKSKFDEYYDILSDKYNNVKDDADELAQKGKVRYEGTKKDVKNAVSDIKY